MVAIGFVLSHEQFPVPRLLDLGVAAEKAGFDMVWTSDHFLPWQDNQGHVGQAWITLAALGQKMGRIAFGTGVTCPTYRYHPAIVAEAFATLGLLYPGRVFLGVGTGEALNEQTVTGQWGSAAGKDPQKMPKHAESFVFVGRKEQAHAAIQKWRFLPNAWKSFVNNPDPREIQRQAEAHILDEEVLQKWVVGDDADTHIAAIGN
jgi:hypothetical protein